MKKILLNTLLSVTLLLGTINNLSYTMEDNIINEQINNNDLFGNNDLRNAINSLNDNDMHNKIIKTCYNMAKECFGELEKITNELQNNQIVHNNTNIRELQNNNINNKHDKNDISLYREAVFQFDILENILNSLKNIKEIEGLINGHTNNDEFHKILVDNKTYELNKFNRLYSRDNIITNAINNIYLITNNYIKLINQYNNNVDEFAKYK